MRFAGENKSAASHFYYTMKTESVEIRRILTDSIFCKLGKCQ